MNLWEYLIYYIVINTYLAQIISECNYTKFAETIENNSNIIGVEIIPLFIDYDKDINHRIEEDIFKISKTFEFACEINKLESEKQVDIEKIYNNQNALMDNIMYYKFKISENLSLQNSNKNSIVSVRSY